MIFIHSVRTSPIQFQSVSPSPIQFSKGSFSLIQSYQISSGSNKSHLVLSSSDQSRQIHTQSPFLKNTNNTQNTRNTESTYLSQTCCNFSSFDGVQQLPQFSAFNLKGVLLFTHAVILANKFCNFIRILLEIYQEYQIELRPTKEYPTRWKLI